MGWAILAGIGAAVFGALWLLGIARSLWSFVGAALMLGAAGYAWQGRPTLAGAPAAAAVKARLADDGLADLRRAMWGRFTYADSYAVAADAMRRTGSPERATQVLMGGMRNVPQSAQLWTGFGDALSAQNEGVLPPAAVLAFEQAMRLAPDHPAPPFFYGVAKVRARDPAGARPLWLKALALSPRDAEYREEIAARLVLLDRLLAMQAAGAARERR